MSSKQNSTISSKPAIDPALQWIGAAAPETTTESQPASQLTSKQADKSASRQVSKGDVEATVMLSARIPAALLRKLRIRAATEGRQMQEIVTEILGDYLEKPTDE
jgi:hypothetical protein